MATQARALFERFGDTERVAPLVRSLKSARPGQFESPRLRMLQDFLLGGGSGGLSGEDQNRLYALLALWERTMPGASGDDGRRVPLQQSFKKPHTLRQALADDIDKAVVDGGWMVCDMDDGGVKHKEYFRCELRVTMQALSEGKVVRLWSGGDAVAPPTDRREDPLDGDAFRESEAEVVHTHGEKAFAAAVHLYSDSCVMSWSGGKFINLSRCWYLPVAAIPALHAVKSLFTAAD